MPPSSLETAEKFCRPGAKNQYSLIRSAADIDRACRVMGGLLAGAGCMDGRVHEAAGEDFRIVKIHRPTHGRITAATGREFPWDLGNLAIAGPAPEPGPDIPVTPELTDFRVGGLPGCGAGLCDGGDPPVPGPGGPDGCDSELCAVFCA